MATKNRASYLLLVTSGLLGALGSACAGSPVEETNNGNGGATASSSSSTASGGMGGAGGEGGGSLCELDCEAINTPMCLRSVCNDGSYEGEVGSCVVINNENGTSCDDDQYCTINDVCEEGTCVGGSPKDCGEPAEQCQVLECDEGTDQCLPKPADNGTNCTSSNQCMLNATCQAGTCTGGMLNNCLFAPVPDDCHVAVCNPGTGMCDPVPGNDGMACVDTNDLCSVGNSCNSGTCEGGSPLNCSALTQGCDVGVCEPMGGTCTTQTVMDGQVCDDLDACTSGELCSAGSCSGGAAITNCELAGDGCCPSTCTAANDLDCQCMTTSLETTFANTSGWDGIMFDLTAKAEIEVQSFESNIDTGMKTIEVYYKAGTHVGFEADAAAWTLIGSAVVDPTAANIGTPVPVPVNVTIPLGQTTAFFVVSTAAGTLSNGVNYVSNVQIGTVQTEDANLQIMGGTGNSTGFAGSTFANRGFSGTVIYERCGN